MVEQWIDGTQVMLVIVALAAGLLVGAVVFVGAFGAVAPGVVIPGAVVPPAPLVTEGEDADARLGAPAEQGGRQSAKIAALRAFECPEFNCLRTATPTPTTHS